MSDRGSIAQPFSLEDRVQSLNMVDPPFPDVIYSKKRKIVSDCDQSHYRQPSPEEKTGPPSVRKRAKSDVHVLVSPQGAEKKPARTRAPFSTHEDGPNGRAGSPRATTIKRERDDSIRPLPRRSAIRAAHKVQPRSPSPDLCARGVATFCSPLILTPRQVKKRKRKYRTVTRSSTHAPPPTPPLCTPSLRNICPTKRYGNLATGTQVKQKWVGHVVQTVLLKEIRLRIATRRDERREATTQEVMTVANDTKILFRGTVIEEDVLRAYESGEERMRVWLMTCVGSDEAFLRDLVDCL